MLRFSTLSFLVALCAADMYLHMPRGSNNRLNEKSANRNNANRCFDSQNNNRGGYNVGEIGEQNGFANNNDYFKTFGEAYTQGFWTGSENGGTKRIERTTADIGAANQAGDQKQTEDYFYEESFMAVTWTNQHGCGENTKVYCQVIAQYAVENMLNGAEAKRNGNNAPSITGSSTDLRGTAFTNAAAQTRFDMMRRLGLRVMLNNGANTNTPGETSSLSPNSLNNQFQNNVNNRRCQHESNEWYSLCRNRDRNKGLFTADQNVRADRATHTRQNPNGNRRGLECAEERDYYPYWYPSPFVDAAVLTDDMAYCKSKIVPESQNTKMKYACTTGAGYNLPENAQTDAFNASQCTAAGGTFEGFSWNMAAPTCHNAPHAQVNHLGNQVIKGVADSSAGGSQAYFMWQLPKYSDLIDQTKVMGLEHVYTAQRVRTLAGAASAAQVTRKCVRMLLRMRYNISTTDYDPYNTNASMNDNPNKRIISPIKQNPTIEMGVLNQGLRLAINTAQTGRTFQDRSHTFLLCERPAEVGTDAVLNVQVQGKRGNIVQTFPATEYQFSPRQWTLCRGNSFHFQWTGSNTHNNGNPAGDGQAGDAGEGRGGSDRHNLVQMWDMMQSYPMTHDKFAAANANAPTNTKNFFDFVSCRQAVTMDLYAAASDAAIAAGTSGFYHSKAYAQAQFKELGSSTGDRLQVLFNNAAATYRGGLYCKASNTLPVASSTEPAPYFAFMCTRNNNFSNRAQKMKVFTAATCGYQQKTTPADAVGSVNPKLMTG